MSERTPALPGRHPERGAAADRGQLRLRDREVVEEKLRRRPRDHAEVRQVGRRVADEEVVDVVLAGVDAGGERRPRGRRLWRMRRLQRRERRRRFASFAMFGSLPSSIQRSSRCGSIPSKPRMTSFWVNFDAPRGDVPEQAIDRAAIARAAAASIRTDLRMKIARIITSCWPAATRQLTAHSSQLTAHSSQLTAHSSQLTAHG